MSRTLRGGEKDYPAVEKEATAIIEAVHKWEHLLARKHLITDQKSVAFMLDNRKRTKIKNNKIQCWQLEVVFFSYTMKCRPEVENVASDALTRLTLAVTNHYDLKKLHENMCHPALGGCYTMFALKIFHEQCEESLFRQDQHVQN